MIKATNLAVTEVLEFNYDSAAFKWVLQIGPIGLIRPILDKRDASRVDSGQDVRSPLSKNDAAAAIAQRLDLDGWRMPFRLRHCCRRRSRG